MSDHKLGEHVLKDTTAKTGDGQSRKIIDLAESTWGAPEPFNNKNIAPEKAGAEAGREIARSMDGGVPKTTLEEASRRIKELNNALHQPGQPMAGSDLELVGFDKKGRLLMIHRGEDGQVDRKVLVDSDSGKIVARTKPDELNKWEKSADYDKAQNRDKVQSVDLSKDKTNHLAKDHPGLTKSLVDGASVWKDSLGRVAEVVDSHGDKRQYKRDEKTNAICEIVMTPQGQPADVYRQVAGQEASGLWYHQPYEAASKPLGVKFEVKDDGTLVLHRNSKERRIYNVNGRITDEDAHGKKDVRGPLLVDGPHLA